MRDWVDGWKVSEGEKEVPDGKTESLKNKTC